MSKLQKLLTSKKVHFYVTQLAVATMLMSIAFCDIFSNVDSKLQNYVTSLTNLGLTCVGFFGVLSFILFVSTSNERTAEKAKTWAIRCVFAIAGIILFSTVVNKGFLYNTINELISVPSGGSGGTSEMVRQLLAA